MKKLRFVDAVSNGIPTTKRRRRRFNLGLNAVRAFCSGRDQRKGNRAPGTGWDHGQSGASSRGSIYEQTKRCEIGSTAGKAKLHVDICNDRARCRLIRTCDGGGGI